MPAETRAWTPSKDAGETQTITEVHQELINRGIAAQWLDLEKHVAWHGRYVLDQVVARRDDDGWTLMVKASRGKQVYIAYVKAETLAATYELAGEWADRGVFAWQHDEYPSKRLKRQLGIP